MIAVINSIWNWWMKLSADANFQGVMDLVGVGSLIISICTLIVALRFKKRIAERKEKIDFQQSKQSYQNKLGGYIKSFTKDQTENMYNKKNIEELRRLLNELAKKYEIILSKSLLNNIKNTYNFVCDTCVPEIEAGNDSNLFLLCEKLGSLKILIEKEEVL